MSAFRKPIRIALTLSIFASLVACGGNETAQQQAPAPVCPACPPPPEPSPPPTADDLLGILDSKLLNEKEIFLEQVKGSPDVKAKVGTKNLSSEDFGKMATFLWAVDPQLRIAYLRALEKTNQLIDTVKPADGGKFDPLAPAAEPDQDFSDRIGETIVDWQLFQRLLVDDLRTLGIENVMAVLPQDDFPQANQMMKDLMPLVMPPPEPGALPSALSFFVSDAYAQDKHGAKPLPTAKLPPPKYPAKATAALKGLPAIKTVTAPLLLARTMSFRVGNGFFVLESPLQAAEPQFTATPVEQYTFKLERKFIGDAYFNEVAGRVTTLANIPQRTQPEWMQMSMALTELDLLYRMINPNFGEAPAIPTTPLAPGAPLPPTSPAAPTAPAVPVTQPAAPSIPTTPPTVPSAPLPPAAPTAPAMPSTPTTPTSGGTAPSGAEPASPADRPQPAPSQAQPTTSADRPSNAPSSAAPAVGAERPQAPQGGLPTDPNAVRPSTQPAPAAPAAPTAP